MLNPGGQPRKHHPGYHQDQRCPRVPGEIPPARGAQHQPGGNRAHQQRRAEEVDLLPPAGVRRQPPQRPAAHYPGQRAKRQVDPENPPPGNTIGERSAEHGPGNAGDAPHATHIYLVAAPLARRRHIGNRRLRDHHQTSAADALHRPPQRNLPEMPRRRAAQGGNREHEDCRLHQPPPPINIRKPPENRRRRRAGQQVCGDNPGDMRPAAQIARHARHRRHNNRLVQRREQNAQRHATNDGENFFVRKLLRPRHAGTLPCPCGVVTPEPRYFVLAEGSLLRT